MHRIYYTERLTLSAARKQDARAIFDCYATDIEVCRYLTFRPHTHIEETKTYLDRCKAGWAAGEQFNFVIRRQEAAAMLGMISYRKNGPHRASFGYALNRTHWGQGYMSEALNKLIEVAFEDPQVYRVEATCDVENRASARVMEKCDMQYEGTLRRHTVLPNISPIPRDVHCYARIRT